MKLSMCSCQEKSPLKRVIPRYFIDFSRCICLLWMAIVTSESNWLCFLLKKIMNLVLSLFKVRRLSLSQCESDSKSVLILNSRSTTVLAKWYSRVSLAYRIDLQWLRHRGKSMTYRKVVAPICYLEAHKK